MPKKVNEIELKPKKISNWFKSMSHDLIQINIPFFLCHELILIKILESFLVMSWFESKYSCSFLSRESIWIKFQKSILSCELIWLNSCKAIVSHEWVESKLSETKWFESKIFWVVPMSDFITPDSCTHETHNSRLRKGLFYAVELENLRRLGRKLLVCDVLMTVFHIWAHCHSKRFHLWIYEPNGLWYKLYQP